jgi:Uma2 family endonuclease
MNVHTAAPIDPDAFLRWNEGREGKRELVRGKVVEMMVGATRSHALLVRRLARSLEDRLDVTRYDVVTNDLGVKTPDGVRYPDVVVDRAGGSGKDLATTAPVLIAEVLSPSSKRTDLIVKAADYTGLPSLFSYLVLSQEEPRAWLWLRGHEAWIGPTPIEGMDGVIEVPGLSLAIPLMLLYPRPPANREAD